MFRYVSTLKPVALTPSASLLRYDQHKPLVHKLAISDFPDVGEGSGPWILIHTRTAPDAAEEVALLRSITERT